RSGCRNRRILLAPLPARRFRRPCRAGQCPRAPLWWAQHRLRPAGAPPRRRGMTIDLPNGPSFRLDGKRALIAGARSGIGGACASSLAQAGAAVTIAARRRVELDEIASATRDCGWTAEALALDIADVERMESTIAAIDPFDILVNS